MDAGEIFALPHMEVGHRAMQLLDQQLREEGLSALEVLDVDIQIGDHLDYLVRFTLEGTTAFEEAQEDDMAQGVTYPDVTVQLTGQDGNVFNIIGQVAKALRRQVSREAADAFTKEAFQSDSYDAVLQLAMRTVEVE
jgi:hypothetical protein